MRRGRFRKQICMGAPPSSGGRDERSGDQAQGCGLRRQRLGHLHHVLGSASSHPPHSQLK